MKELAIVDVWKRLQRVARSLTTQDFAEDVASAVMVKILEKDLSEPFYFIQLKHMMIDELRKVRRYEKQLPEGLEAVAKGLETQASVELEVQELMKDAGLTVAEGRVVYYLYYANGAAQATAKIMTIEKEEVCELERQAMKKLRSAAARAEGKG